MSVSSSRRFILLLLAVASTACTTSTAAPSASQPEASSPPAATATTGTSGDVPQRIVSLSPSSTEILYAIGAGDQVVATDVYSTHPQGTPVTEMSGFDPNVEALAELDPDLVVASGDRNDLVAGMEAIGVDVVIHESADDLDDVWDQIAALGERTGHADAADELVGDMQAELDQLTSDLPDGADALSFYHELSAGYYTATSDTFVGQLYALLGLENIADAAPGAGESGGYPQLSAEYVVEANPDLVFIAAAEDQVEPPAARPGWDQLTAVEEEAVVFLDPDVASRWGPRIVEQVATVRDAVEAHLADGA